MSLSVGQEVEIISELTKRKTTGKVELVRHGKLYVRAGKNDTLLEFSTRTLRLVGAGKSASLKIVYEKNND